MARTAITVTRLPAYLETSTPTKTAGDAANDHSIDATVGKLIVVAVNNNALAVSYTVEIPAASSTFNETVSKTHTVAAAAGGRAGVEAFGIDIPNNALQSGGVVHIDSADANFGDVDFVALVTTPTPR